MRDAWTFKNFVIERNRVPEQQFDFGGFGWAFRVFSSTDQMNSFHLVVKYPFSDYDDKSIDIVLNQGREEIQRRIENAEYKRGGYYCYWWEPLIGIQADDCDNVSPGAMRTPVINAARPTTTERSSSPIFISYSRIDWDQFVKPLIMRLEVEGLPYWVDQHLIEGGDNWIDEIGKALKNSDRMIVCISPDALESEFVQMEYRHFVLRRKTKKLYPLMCRSSELPFELEAIQYYPYSRLDDLVNLLKQ